MAATAFGMHVQAPECSCLPVRPPPSPSPPVNREWQVPADHFDLDSGALIAFVARCTAEVVRQHSAGAGGGGTPVIGFCFSFPIEQTALDNGRVLSMTKVGGSV